MLAIALENEVRLAQNFSTKLSSKVSVLKYYPGFDSSLFSVFLDNTKYEVCIIESFGAGNLPYGQVLEQAIQYFIANGGFVINKTQCVQGAVNQNTYKTGNWLAKLGVLPAMDMTLEALLTKCMYLVANQKMNRFLEKLASEYTS
jgi:L-asparaginase